MPHLSAFLVCEKVIISAEDNSANVIGVFHGLRVAGPTPPTEDAPVTVPIRWCTFTTWVRTPADDGVTYEQKIELVAPSGKVLLSQASEFALMKAHHRHTTNVFGMPAAGVGEHLLRLSLRAVASGDPEYRVVLESPIDIHYEGPVPAAAKPAEHAH